jgi:hypothetical protein
MPPKKGKTEEEKKIDALVLCYKIALGEKVDEEKKGSKKNGVATPPKVSKTKAKKDKEEEEEAERAKEAEIAKEKKRSKNKIKSKSKRKGKGKGKGKGFKNLT